VTSSVLRLPRVVRNTYLSALWSPIVLFVHPWEFVDLRRERLRLDCRFKTGDIALDCVRDVLRSYARRGARFVRMDALCSRAM
jgi:peptidoglycan-N-acetylglucosamine deacetylase